MQADGIEDVLTDIINVAPNKERFHRGGKNAPLPWTRDAKVAKSELGKVWRGDNFDPEIKTRIEDAKECIA